MIKKLLFVFSIMVLLHSEGNAGTAGWGYIPHYAEMNYISLNNAIKKYDIICFTGTFINSDGVITSKRNRLTMNIHGICRQQGKILYPLISFSSPAAGRSVLSSTALTDRASKNIHEFIIKNDYPGVHLDIEYIEPAYIRGFEHLLSSLRENPGRRTISAALYPQLDYSNPFSGLHNPGIISKYLDYAVLMSYDLHCPGTGPGPVTDLRWSEKNLQHLLKFMDRKKIFLGIPAYGYLWSKGKKTSAVSAGAASKLKNKHAFTRHKSGTVFISLPSGEAYLSDGVTVKQMVKLSERYAIAGWALWRIGFEDNQ